MKHSEKIQVRIDPELLERLRLEAAARGLGMSALVRWALLSFFDAAPPRAATSKETAA